MSVLSSLKSYLSRGTKQSIKENVPGPMARLLERLTKDNKETEGRKRKGPGRGRRKAATATTPVGADAVQAAPARVRPPIAPAVILARFERSGQQLADIPVEDASADFEIFDLAKAYGRYGNVERALRCMDYIPKWQHTMEHVRFLAQQYASLSQYDMALRQLDRIQIRDLSAEAARKIDLERIRYLRQNRDYDAALALGARLVEEFPGSIETKLTYADVLTIAGQSDEAGRLYHELLSNPNHHISVAERYIDYLYETNKVFGTELLLTVSMGRHQRPIGLLWRKCRYHWIIGDAAGFNETCAELATQIKAGKRLPVAGIAFFAPLAEEEDGEWTGMTLVNEAVAAFLTGQQKDLRDPTRIDSAISLLNDALTFGDPDIIHAYARELTTAFPYAARGWYALGLQSLEQYDFPAAEAALRKSMDLNPANADPYPALFNTIAAKPGRLAELEELIATRNRLVPKFNDFTPDGRQRFYDHEGVFLNFIRGDYVAAYAIRNNQPANRYLETTYPNQYLALQDDALPVEKTGSVCVVGQDGVGDEIRWAQYYPALADRFEQVRISCDPRLAPIFQRSFPAYEFLPVARRWPHVPWRAQERREEVPHFGLSGKVNADLQYQLSRSNRIMIIEEVAYHLWKQEGTKGPKCAFTGPYLKPEPDLAAAWKRKLDDEAKNRLKVGVVWRSALMSRKRAIHFMTVRDLAPLARLDCSLVSLQPKITEEETLACERMGIRIHDDLDLFDDFEGIAALTAGLDLVIGISTLPLELAAATGTECWILNFNAFGKHVRLGPESGERDINTANSIVICGDQDGNFALPQKQLIRNAIDRTTERLRTTLAARKPARRR